MRNRSFLIVLGVLIAASGAEAAPSRWVAPNGVVIYADRPPQAGDLARAEPAEAPAPIASDAERGAVDEVLALSGFKQQIVALAGQLRTGVPAPPGGRGAAGGGGGPGPPPAAAQGRARFVARLRREPPRPERVALV